MKWDRKIGRIVQHEGVYELVPNWRPRSPGLAQGEELICWHEVGEQLPDAELTVLARLRGGSEPVWLASWDGDVWRDTDGMVVEVIRWCDLPQGGAE